MTARRDARASGDTWLAGVGLLALLACAGLGMAAPRTALLCYLAAWWFWLAPVLGSFALLCIHALTGGDWGMALRPPLLAMTGRLWRLVVLALPLLVGMALVYPWMHGAPGDDAFARQRWYLDPYFFVARTVLAFAAWLVLAAALRRRLVQRRGITALAAGGLIAHALLVTVTAVDWVMSLVPAWHSSTFGLLAGTAQMLCAAAAAVTLAGPASLPVADWTDQRRRDLGNLLLAVLLGFGYLAYMDYLTTWIADLPTETAWYLPRLRTGWAWLGAGLVVGHLVVPFFLLLWRRAKQAPRVLAAIAALLWLAQLGFAVWLVLPGQIAGPAWTWLLPLAVAGIGGLWWPGLRRAMDQARVGGLPA